jgi:hypothetical protein
MENLGFREQGMRIYLVTALLLVSAVHAEEIDSVIDVGSKKQVFLDGFFLEIQENVRLTMHKPYRDGQILLQSDQPWEMDPAGVVERIGIYSCVLKEDGIVRLWYDCRRGEADKEIRVCYAESEDGIHFRKPALGLHKVDGSKENNVVLPGPRIAGAAVWLDPNASPERRYKTQTKVYPSSKLEMHSSPDGIHWELFAIPEVGHIDTQNIILWEPSIEKYLFFTRLWAFDNDPIKRYRTVRRLESTDLITWNNEIIVMEPDARDWGIHERVQDRPAVDFYGGGVFRYEEADRAYFMFAQSTWAWMDWEEEGLGPATIDVQLAVSRDLEHFTRVGDRGPFLGLGPEGRFDSRFIWAMPNPVRMDDEIWIYYVASNRDHSPSNKLDPAASKDLSGIGRAVLRLDGFVSVDGGYQGGSFTTPLMRFQGNALELNVDAAGGGAVWVEILDKDGDPIEGYSKDDALPIARNSVRMAVAWKGDGDLSALAGIPIRLRFHLTNASLYAFQFKKGIAKK